MCKTLVLEAMYEVISDSLEWGLDCKDGSFNYHIDGIVALTDKILDKIKIEENIKLAEESLGYINSTENAFKNSIATH